jgi:hypothetical protein
VKMSGDNFGADMPRQTVMSLVSRLPTPPSAPTHDGRSPS